VKGGSELKNMSNQEYTVNHAIDTLGFGYYQFLLSFIVGMAWVADAMEMMILRLRPFGFLPVFRHTVAHAHNKFFVLQQIYQLRTAQLGNVDCRAVLWSD
jgi:hypothetical protein